MSFYVCDACNARIEADEAPPVCGSCGAGVMVAVAAEAGLEEGPPAPAARQTAAAELLAVPAPLQEQNTLVLGPAEQAQAARADAALADPAPALQGEKTLELGAAEREAVVRAADARAGEPAAPLREEMTRVLEPGEQEAAARAADAAAGAEAAPPLLAQATLELDGGAEAAPPLLKQSTLELDERDLEAAPTPPAPPLLPRRRVGRITEELIESDLEELKTPPAPPPAGPPRPPAAQPQTQTVVSPRALRWRVAFPVNEVDLTPPPTTLPVEVDELAVAGEPPAPSRQKLPLPGQTERLASSRRRRRQRRLVVVAVAVAAGLVGAAVYVATRPGEEPEPLAALTAQPPDQRALPAPDLPHPDRGADRWSPDRSSPDRAQRPVHHRVAAGRPAQKAGWPAERPDAGSRTAPGAVVEAKSAYRKGLRRLMQGDPAQAIQSFNEALQKAPRLGLAYRGLGLAYEKQGSKAMARAAFERYLLIQPNADDVQAIRQRIERLK